MSCECSVVSTAAGGVVEVIQHGVNGFLTINEDLDGLTNFIEALVVDEQLRKSIGVAARLRVIEEFSLANHVRHLLELYERCLE
jgi:glycosyltransferase involved in cell wall biosynthesis